MTPEERQAEFAGFQNELQQPAEIRDHRRPKRRRPDTRSNRIRQRQRIRQPPPRPLRRLSGRQG